MNNMSVISLVICSGRGRLLRHLPPLDTCTISVTDIWTGCFCCVFCWKEGRENIRENWPWIIYHYWRHSLRGKYDFLLWDLPIGLAGEEPTPRFLPALLMVRTYWVMPAAYLKHCVWTSPMKTCLGFPSHWALCWRRGSTGHPLLSYYAFCTLYTAVHTLCVYSKGLCSPVNYFILEVLNYLLFEEKCCLSSRDSLMELLTPCLHVKPWT